MLHVTNNALHHVKSSFSKFHDMSRDVRDGKSSCSKFHDMSRDVSDGKSSF